VEQPCHLVVPPPEREPQKAQVWATSVSPKPAATGGSTQRSKQGSLTTFSGQNHLKENKTRLFKRVSCLGKVISSSWQDVTRVTGRRGAERQSRVTFCAPCCTYLGRHTASFNTVSSNRERRSHRHKCYLLKNHFMPLKVREDLGLNPSASAAGEGKVWMQLQSKGKPTLSGEAHLTRSSGAG